MAPATKPQSDTILHVFNDDFFKHKHCPMRTGNVRCRNKSTCDRVDFGNQSGPQNAVKLRDQLMRQVGLLAKQEPTTASPVWSSIQTKVEMLIDWVLCQKHTMQRDAAISMTISFLKQDCGIFVEDRQSAQSHIQLPTDSYQSSTMPLTAEYAPFYSTATHLATPPMTPSTTTQEHLHQQPFVFTAGVPVKKNFPAGRPVNRPQQDPFVFPFGDHVKHNTIKTESGTDNQAAPPRVLGKSSQESHTASMSADSKVSRSQPVPFGFNVRTPSSKQNATEQKSAQQSQETHTKSKQPSETVQTAKDTAPKSQTNRPQVPFGF